MVLGFRVPFGVELQVSSLSWEWKSFSRCFGLDRSETTDLLFLLLQSFLSELHCCSSPYAHRVL